MIPDPETIAPSVPDLGTLSGKSTVLPLCIGILGSLFLVALVFVLLCACGILPQSVSGIVPEKLLQTVRKLLP